MKNNSNQFGEKLKKMENKFKNLYKTALKLKNQGDMTGFFDTDNKLQLVTEEIKVLTGEEEFNIKQRLTEE